MLRQLMQFDQSIYTKLPETIIGIDEVGRGCLAGPVVAAAVSLPPLNWNSKLNRSLKQLNDSKKITSAVRESLATTIQECAVCAIGEASVEEINELNILRATLLAMKRARRALKVIPHAVLLVDGNQCIPGLSDPQIPIIKGDGKSASIAAASIIAKVYRDALMTRLSVSFAPYCFERNKGYGSAAHLQAISTYGPTKLHRLAFIREVSPTLSMGVSRLEAQFGKVCP